LLEAGDLAAAAAEFERAVDGRPQDFWPHYYQGVCAYRGRHYAEAVAAFGVCTALAPGVAECYHNRGLARLALGQSDRARRGFDRALELKPTLAAAAFNRGLLAYHAHEYAAAEQDLRSALAHGADAALVYYNLALVHVARRDNAQALEAVQHSLRHNPDYPEALDLRARLVQKTR
jgi:tetratricopeptide (TPR) repeat protein